jgi:hypothetical protein
MSTNLPPKQIQDSAARTRLYFDVYGTTPLEYNAVDYDAAIGFFKGKGFEDSAAQVVATTLLKQAKLENISISKVLDDIAGLDTLKISALVGEVLNNNRPATSTLGYRQPVEDTTKQRNVSP